MVEQPRGVRMRVQTKPVRGFVMSLVLLATGRIRFDKSVKGKRIVTPDGKGFRIFRRVEIKSPKPSPEARFIVRFKPSNMTLERNEKFSRIPMLVFMGFKGFRSKYWCDDQETGLCQGVYEWQTLEDAKNYSESIAMKFTTDRSDPGTVEFQILDNSEVRLEIA
jgi:hypothetical protein